MQRSVLEYLEATVARLGDKTAFADEHGAVTFGELEDRSRRLGSWLARKVPDNGMPIAVLADRCVNSPVAFMAALQCGCCYVPLDPQMPRQRLESILDQLESPVVLYDDGQEKLAAELRDRYPLESISAHTADLPGPHRSPVPSSPLVTLFPLVPGGGIYYAMEHAINGETDLFLSTLLHTLGLAGSLAVGILLVSSLVRLVNGLLHRRAQRGDGKG